MARNMTPEKARGFLTQPLDAPGWRQTYRGVRSRGGAGYGGQPFAVLAQVEPRFPRYWDSAEVPRHLGIEVPAYRILFADGTTRVAHGDEVRWDIIESETRQCQVIINGQVRP